MRIEEHPFHILGITPRSSRQEISNRAEALSIRLDPAQINACRLQVTHPAKRIETEVSWFPSVRPSRIQQVVDAIRQDPNLLTDLDGKLSGVDCLGRFNALAYWLTARADVSGPAWALALHHLAENLQHVDVHELTASLNADRSVAGFPQIIDVTAVETAVTRLSQNTAAFLAEHLMLCPRQAQVLTLLVERDTDSGESQASVFVDRFVDRYQILVQPMLDRHSERIAADCERILLLAKQHPTRKARIHAAIGELESRLSDWGAIARPIQFLMKSRGLKDSHSIEVGKRVRSTAIELANDFDLHEQAQRIARRLSEVFGKVPELAELIDEDLAALERIVRAKDVSQAREEPQQTEFEFGDDEYCPNCGRPMVLQKGHSGRCYVCTRPECDNAGSADARPAQTAQSAEAQAANASTGVEGFSELCRSITLNLWQKMQTRGSEDDESLAALKTAYNDYWRQVSPWLAIICANPEMDKAALIKARNAAAECLSVLAKGFVDWEDLDVAESLCREAFQLVISDAKLAAVIMSQLIDITSKKQASVGSTPQTATSGTTRLNAFGLGSDADDDSTSQVERSSRSPMQYVLDPNNRLALVVAVGIAAMVAIFTLISAVSAPEWQPSIEDLTAGQTATRAERQSPQQESQRMPRTIPNSASDSTPLRDYRQNPAVPEATAPFPPAVPPHKPVSLRNGTDLIPPPDSEGLGKLIISNHASTDAAVKLRTSPDKETVRFFYVRAMSDVTISHIAPGDYILQFVTGRDWDTSGLIFREDLEFAGFDNVMSFSERKVEDGTIYSTHSVTLHTVPNGNVRKRGISAQDFLEDGHRRRNKRTQP
jgi:hypothetical protein